MRLLRLIPLASLSLFGAYTYFFSDTFSSGINTTTWQSNGTVSTGSNGLVSTATNGGSVIYKLAIPDGTAEYEAKATLRIGDSGGKFVIYLRASADALTGPATQGSYYAMELTPTVTVGGCTMVADHYKRVGGTVTLLASQTLACADNMTVRLAQRNGYYMGLTSLGELIFIGDSSLTTGQPGFGARGLPAQNGILRVDIGPADRVAPGAFDPLGVRSSVFDNRVDLSWPGIVDDANGSGLAFYQIYRNGVFYSNFRTANWTDTAVSAATTYTYLLRAVDMNHNVSETTVTVTTPVAGMRDPRKTGVRPLGTYWGASPENIDLQSGNLSFSLPTVTAQGRGGTSVPFRLSYNSQNWRKDSSATWKLGTDVGYGFGWKMLAGSLTPVYSGWWTVNHYLYVDSTGAEYRLDQNTNGVWSSKEGLFVNYDAATGRLYFPGGTFWEFGCTANGTEADAGTMYPTRLVDTNGNEIKVRYQGGLFYGGTNGSARVNEIEDVRAQYVNGVGYRTYVLTYNNDAVPHLTGITSDIGDGTSFTLSYTSGHALSDPFSAGSFGTTTRLNTMTVPGAYGLQFAMEYNAGSQELKKVTMPLGGTMEWIYGAKTLAGTRTQMEVTSRIINAQDGQGSKTYTLNHNDSADLPLLAHAYTVVVDASLKADKAYFFFNANDYRLGLFSSLSERRAVSGAADKNIRNTSVQWAQTPNGNPYIANNVQVIDVEDATATATQVAQTIDDYGNLVLRKQYGHHSPGGTAPLLRTFTYTYLADPNYVSRYIRNRLVSVTMLHASNPTPFTLVTNTYDSYSNGQIPAVSFPSLLRQHDTAGYGTNFTYRGNVTVSTSQGKATSLVYDYTGNVGSTSDGHGHFASMAMDENRNYAVPKTQTGGSLQTAYSWNSYNAPLTATGPNGDITTFSYNQYARPASTTAADGRVTAFTYGSNWTLATTGTRWTRTTVDGFGRTVKAESGFNTGSTPTTVSIADTQYAPCACSPMGKLWKTSLPYAPGGTVYWTEHVYDALGRTVAVNQPNNAGTTTTSYAGAVVTVTDPAGKWKRYENDALGNLIKVTEPPIGLDPEYATSYSYSEFGKLVQVSMPRPGKGTGNASTVTQIRSWVYDGATQRLSSVNHPESGTTAYTYNGDGSVATKVDAKNQKTVYAYDSDGRVTSTRRYPTPNNEDGCARVDYYYGSQPFDGSFTQNAAGRLAAAASGCQYSGAGHIIEMYSYTAAGAVVKKRMRMIRNNMTVDKDVAYSYGGDGKLATVLYPGTTVPFSYTYDLMDRPIKMTGPSPGYGNLIDQVKEVNYNVAGQVTSMQYVAAETQDTYPGSGDPYGVPQFLQEAKTFDSLFQLTRQTATSGASVLADIGYEYAATSNNGRITARTNYVRGAGGERVGYLYDNLNRVTSAGVTGGWTQSFDYDGFGNLWSQTMTNGTATPMSVNLEMAKNRINSSGWAYDANGNTVTMPASGGGTVALVYDVDNRLVKWGTEEYAYLPNNKRVWKKAPGGTEQYYFYGADGRKLMTMTVASLSPFVVSNGARDVYFAGKMIQAEGSPVVHDRLGSVVWRAGVQHDYLPYGEEMGVATAGNRNKFGTYYRDQTSALDYADQRYFAALSGRFLTADPYEASGGASEPGSWNRYPYVGGDPVGNSDATGLYSEAVSGPAGTDLDSWLNYSLNQPTGGPCQAPYPCFNDTEKVDTPTYVYLSQLQLPSGWSYDCVDSTCNEVRWRIPSADALVLGGSSFLPVVIGVGIAIGGGAVADALGATIVITTAGILLAKTIEWWGANRTTSFPSIDDIKANCMPGRLVVEPATAREYRGGISYEQEYVCGSETYSIHWIEREGKIIHGPHPRRGAAKGGGGRD